MKVLSRCVGSFYKHFKMITEEKNVLPMDKKLKWY